MTRRQQQLQKRDIQIRKESKETPVEDLMEKYHLSFAQMYRILRATTEKEMKDYYRGK